MRLPFGADHAVFGSMIFLISLAITLATFVADLLTPRGFAGGVFPYFIAVALSAWTPLRLALFMFAGLAAVLSMVGLAFTSGGDPTMVAVNRAVIIGCLALTAVLAHSRLALEQLLRRQAAGLQGEVVKTADELRDQNKHLEDEIARSQQAEERARQSEAKFQDLYENAPVMYMNMDLATKQIVACNNIAVVKTGFEKSEIIGKSVMELYDPACAPAIKGAIEGFKKDGKVTDLELVMLKKDGGTIDINLNVSAIRDDAGNIVLSRSVFQDITQRKKAEKDLRASETALRHSEARFRDFAEAASDWYWESDAELRFTYVSERINRCLGVGPEYYLGKRRTELQGVTGQAEWQAHLSDLEARRPFRDFTYAQKMPSGQLKHFRISGRPQFGQDGTFLGYRGAATDITEAVEEERQRQNAEIRLARAIEATPASFALFDAEDRLVTCNQLYRSIYEAEPGLMKPGVRYETLVRAFASRIAANEAEAWIETRLSRRQDPAQKLQYRHSDNRWSEVSDYLLDDGSVITLAVDITDLKEANQALRDRQEQLAQVLRRSTMGEMAAALAHELNQPLTAINNYARGCLRRLQDGRIDIDEFVEATGDISEQATRASDILRHISGFISNERPAPTPADINDVVKAALTISEAALAKADISVITNLEDDLPLIAGAKIELEQVVLNLVRNAIDAMRDVDGERILTMTTATRDDTVQLTISDRGPGFPKDVRQTLFEPFVTTKQDGLGMGLCISRTIIEAHGGRIDVNDGDGATVTCSIPIDQTGVSHAA